MLEITEIFQSLQGEGPFSGKPAVFVRLSGCIEPFCPWCDTMHAFAAGSMMSVEAVFQKISKFAARLVVITGGEPFLQWHSGLNLLEEQLLVQGYRLQYETSGKIEIPADVNGFIVCSPKRIDGHWVFDNINIERAQVFKFVTDGDFDEIRGFVKRFRIPSERVFIMPKGARRHEQLDKFQETWKFCVENNFCFSPRLHILTFDNKQGV